jgi:hypothetical protein
MRREIDPKMYTCVRVCARARAPVDARTTKQAMLCRNTPHQYICALVSTMSKLDDYMRVCVCVHESSVIHLAARRTPFTLDSIIQNNASLLSIIRRRIGTEHSSECTKLMCARIPLPPTADVESVHARMCARVRLLIAPD